MRILAIDTSLTSVSACVYDSVGADMLAVESLLMSRGHAEALLPLIERIIAQVAGGFSTLDRVAVTVGPGSFTGIRVGVAAARAIGVALSIPVVGVSTLAAFAGPLVLERGVNTIVSAIDARHNQVYIQTFDPDGRTIMRPHIANAREVAGRLGKGPFRMTGSAGAIMAIEAWAQCCVADTGGEMHNPSIEFVARLGLSADPDKAPPDPLYLKAADVTRAAPVGVAV